jgi:hypothetical protein
LHSTTGSIIARIHRARETAHIQSKIFPERRHDYIAGFLQAFEKSVHVGAVSVPAQRGRDRERCFDAARDADAALFSIRLHSVRKERIGVAQISAGEFLTRRLFAPVRACTARTKTRSPNEPAARIFARPLAHPGYDRIVRSAYAAFATFSGGAVSIARM